MIEAGFEDEPTPPESIHEAAARGRIHVVSRMLDAGVFVDVLPPAPASQTTALGYAAARGHADVCELLLVRGADPDPPHAVTKPLYEAARHGRCSACRVLIRAGASVHTAHGVYNESLLRLAIRRKNIALCSLLIGSHADCRPLLYHISILKKVVEHGPRKVRAAILTAALETGDVSTCLMFRSMDEELTLVKHRLLRPSIDCSRSAITTSRVLGLTAHLPNTLTPHAHASGHAVTGRRLSMTTAFELCADDDLIASRLCSSMLAMGASTDEDNVLHVGVRRNWPTVCLILLKRGASAHAQDSLGRAPIDIPHRNPFVTEHLVHFMVRGPLRDAGHKLSAQTRDLITQSCTYDCMLDAIRLTRKLPECASFEFTSRCELHDIHYAFKLAEVILRRPENAGLSRAQAWDRAYHSINWYRATPSVLTLCCLFGVQLSEIHQRSQKIERARAASRVLRRFRWTLRERVVHAWLGVPSSWPKPVF